jgi:5'-nucleotidase
LKVLVSNDDGIFSPGIHELARAIAKVADEVIVVAPDVEQSASGHAITIRRPLRYRRTRLEELPDMVCYRVDGTPADCVVLGVHNEGRPDVVVSGINLGSNLGFDVTHSGTVAAAIEGTTMGIPSIAVSLRTGEEVLDFSHAAKYMAKLVLRVHETGLPHRTFLNVNFPESAPLGVVTSRLSTHSYKDSVVRREDPDGVPYYWVAGTPTGEHVEDTDFTAVSSGYATVTPLSLDLTDHRLLESLAQDLPEIGD